jgi:hypothetical protein
MCKFVGEFLVVVGKPEGGISVGRPRCKWVENIKINLKWIVGYELDSSGSG